MKGDCPIDKFSPPKSREDNTVRLKVLINFKHFYYLSNPKLRKSRCKGRNSGKFSFPTPKTRSVQKLLFTVVVLSFHLTLATRSFSRQLTTTEQLCIDDYDN